MTDLICVLVSGKEVCKDTYINVQRNKLKSIQENSFFDAQYSNYRKVKHVVNSNTLDSNKPLHDTIEYCRSLKCVRVSRVIRKTL